MNTISPVIYAQRRALLIERVKQHFSQKNGKICLFAGFESERCAFVQESNFYYLTGITEPGVVLLIDLSGKTTLYLPRFSQNRADWVITRQDYEELGINAVEYLGQPMAGYTVRPFFEHTEYENLLAQLQQIIDADGSIFTIMPKKANDYSLQLFLLERIAAFIPKIKHFYVDISLLLAHLRQVKGKDELSLMYQAVDVTMMGHEAAVRVISPGVGEYEVQAAIEYVFTAAQAHIAFPTIVGSGKYSTVLHYIENNQIMKQGELVVVDIGAMHEHYCGDLTRTYPVSGSFTKRQREIYDLVLETQEYIASIARPGLWLSNREHPDKSLHHIAQAFLKERGYDKYFIHGLGHYLGLDVHDAGDYAQPLQAGEIITIEPGIYIPEESIGVRIEDNYWITEGGAICLSEQLPKEADAIEQLIQSDKGS